MDERSVTMKTGQTLPELATEILRQARSKRDYVAPTTALRYVPPPVTGDVPGGGSEALMLEGVGEYAITDHAHGQLAEHLGIPKKYYERMRVEKPELLATNINTWLAAKPEKRLVRTLDGQVRAFLSDKYRPLDHIDLAEVVLPVLQRLEVEIVSCAITETRLYLKAVDRRIAKDIPTGRRLGDGHVWFDTLSPAIVMSNSEVGAGALSVEAGVWTKLCTNLAIAASRSMKKYHLGGRLEMGEDLAALLSDRTRQLTDAALWAQVRDVVAGAFERARFDALVEEIRGTTERRIEGDPIQVVEVTAKRFDLTDQERGGVLNALIEAGDLSQYGLHAAVTRYSQRDEVDYERATALERLGGQILDLSPRDWQALTGPEKVA
jgi:hypothetical protein